MIKEKALELLNTYGKAWVTQNPDLIATIFTEDATYNDPHEPENIGREAIRAYWVSKVVGEQKDISFKLLNYWVTENEVIAEWYAEFTDIKRNLKIQMTEVAIFKVKGDKFGALREYYKTVKTPL
ncbi:MAG: nuclear transport factor 2 family protein [Patescibacteria group bacterium]